MLGDARLGFPFAMEGAPAVALDDGLGVLAHDDVVDGAAGRAEHRALDLADVVVEMLDQVDALGQALLLPLGLGVLPEPLEQTHPLRAALVPADLGQNFAAGHNDLNMFIGRHGISLRP